MDAVTECQICSQYLWCNIWVIIEDQWTAGDLCSASKKLLNIFKNKYKNLTKYTPFLGIYKSVKPLVKIHVNVNPLNV